jgi:integrase
VKEVPTLEQFQDRFLANAEINNKPSWVHQKRGVLRHHLVPVFGASRLDQIGPPEIEQYKARKLKERLSAKSVNNHLTILRKLLNLAVEWREVPHAPRVRGLRTTPTEIEFLSFEEAERFLRAAAPEWKAFLVLALRTGLRVGELLGLKWADVDLVAGRLMVRRTVWRDLECLPKGGRAREVPLSNEAVAVLKEHRHLKGPYVFCEPDGTRLTHSRVKNVVPRACQRAGLAKRLTTHGLRHSFASHLVMRGASLKAVQELLGHESIEMTLRYSHLTPDVKREAVRLLDRRVAPGDIQETEEGQRRTPRRTEGLDGAGKGI